MFWWKKTARKEDRKGNLQCIMSFVVQEKTDIAVWERQFVGRVA